MNYFSTVVRNYNRVTVYKIHGRKKENSIINSSTGIQ